MAQPVERYVVIEYNMRTEKYKLTSDKLLSIEEAMASAEEYQNYRFKFAWISYKVMKLVDIK